MSVEGTSAVNAAATGAEIPVKRRPTRIGKPSKTNPPPAKVAKKDPKEKEPQTIRMQCVGKVFKPDEDSSDEEDAVSLGKLKLYNLTFERGKMQLLYFSTPLYSYRQSIKLTSLT